MTIRSSDASATAAGRGEDMAVLRSLLERLADCWTRGDGAGYGAMFTEDADYVVFDGSHLKGREAIADSHQKLFDSILKGSELIGGITDIRFLSDDVVLLHSVGAVRLRWQKEAPKGRDSIQTMVAVRDGNAWRITAFQNTRVKPPGWFQKLFLTLVSG